MQGVWNGDQCEKYKSDDYEWNGKTEGDAAMYSVGRGVPLEQVSRFKYLGSWITEDARSDKDIRARVGMAKAAFWQNKELMRRNIRLSTKMKILNCYVFSVLDYGCETWTWNRPMRLKVNAFEMWCYRMILGISWRDKVSNKKVMIRVQTELQTELHFTKDMIKRKLEYA